MTSELTWVSGDQVLVIVTVSQLVDKNMNMYKNTTQKENLGIESWVLLLLAPKQRINKTTWAIQTFPVESV